MQTNRDYAYLSGGDFAGEVQKMKKDRDIIRISVTHADGFYLRYRCTGKTMSVHKNGETIYCEIFDYEALEQRSYSSGKPKYYTYHD